MRVLHLDVLMTHQRPSAQVRSIQVRCPFEVLYRLLVFRSQRVMVADEAANLRPVLVNREKVVCEFG